MFIQTLRRYLILGRRKHKNLCLRCVGKHSLHPVFAAVGKHPVFTGPVNTDSVPGIRVNTPVNTRCLPLRKHANTLKHSLVNTNTNAQTRKHSVFADLSAALMKRFIGHQIQFAVNSQPIRSEFVATAQKSLEFAEICICDFNSLAICDLNSLAICVH